MLDASPPSDPTFRPRRDAEFRDASEQPADPSSEAEPVVGANQQGYEQQASQLTASQFWSHEAEPWAIGPFVRDDAWTFRPPEWPDRDGAGWRSGSVFNPSPIVVGQTLHLFYRSAPRKESLGSRIGHATYRPATGWVDDPANPVVRPTLECEVLGVEDPKVYRRGDGLYVLFYNGIWKRDAPVPDTEPDPLPGVGSDVMAAISTDLVTWQKVGRVVPRDVSRGWAKGAVIPRTPLGDAVRIDGEYLMYLSEGCGGRLTVGRSSDLLTWTFEPADYLDLGELGSLHEVACASIGHGRHSDLVLDFFYTRPDGRPAAGQARYDRRAPLSQLDLSPGGSLAWGGFSAVRDGLFFAQGWDAPAGARELYFYRAVPPRLSVDAVIMSANRPGLKTAGDGPRAQAAREGREGVSSNHS